MKTVIGIDPDVNKSGYAVFRDGELVTATTMNFPDLYASIRGYITNTLPCNSLTIVVEAGWLNTSNWHLGRIPSLARAAKIGESVGRCHQVGLCLLSLLYRDADGMDNVRIVEQKPLKKIWQGRDNKITQGELERVIGRPIKQTNQEGRDACLLAYTHRHG